MRARAALALVLVALPVLLAAGCGGSASGGGPAPSLGSLAGSGAGHRFYEIYDPPGAARGTMLLLHGGSWMDQRGLARQQLAQTALAFRALGLRVVNISYSPGWGRSVRGRPNPLPMLRDVVAFYDQVKRAFGGPVCAYGESAGGHLAAMLAIERPSLTCLVLAAAPLDLETLLHQTTAIGAAAIRATFGRRSAQLRSFSPALLWNPSTDRTPVFATAASNDTTVPPAQLSEFQRVDPSVDAQVVPGAAPGSANALPWMHSDVDRSAILGRLTSLDAWLDRILPPVAGAAPAPSASAAGGIGSGAGCDSPGTARSQLLIAGDAWRQSSTAGQSIAATRGCSGSAQWQDDGLSLWALPSSSGVVSNGAQSSLTLTLGRVVHSLAVSFRGFLARPSEWVLGLYASTGAHTTILAGCVLGRCQGLRLVPRPFGALIAAAMSKTNDPDSSASPQAAVFTLPPGTTRLAWQLRCGAPTGCPLAGIDTAGHIPRPRDPLGHPAIFSIYRASTG